MSGGIVLNFPGVVLYAMRLHVLSIVLAVAATICHGVLQPARCYQGHRYARSENFTRWLDARSSCPTSGAGQLATIDDQDEQDFIFQTFFENSTPNIWIGLNDFGFEAEDEGNFTWTDGSNSAYRNWEQGQPNATGDCVIASRASGKWSDIRCGISRERFLCEEVPPAPGEWFACGDKEWRLFAAVATWRAAERTCQANGGHLSNRARPADVACARRALRTCLLSDSAPVAIAFDGFHDLFTAGTYVWSSNNAIFSQPPGAPQPQHTVCGGFREAAPDTNLPCGGSYPFVCERPFPNASNPFRTSCDNLTYTYNPLAFSWGEADSACQAQGSVLFDQSVPAQRDCVDQLLSQSAFANLDRTVPVWVQCQPRQCSSGIQCPSWQYSDRSSGNSGAGRLNCDTAHPYICVSDGIDDCAAQPCLNGGECVDEVNGFRCACPTAFTGDACEQVVSCDSCLNGALCQSGGMANCTCRSGFSGPLCGIVPPAIMLAPTIPTASNTATQGQPGSGETSDGASISTSAIIGGAIGICLALGAALLVFLILRRRKKNRKIPSTEHPRLTTAVSNALYANQANAELSHGNNSHIVHMAMEKQQTSEDEYENTIPAEQCIIYAEAEERCMDSNPLSPSQRSSSQRRSTLTLGQSNVSDQASLSPQDGSSAAATTRLIDSPKATSDPTYHTLEREDSAAQKTGSSVLTEATYATLERENSCDANVSSDDGHGTLNAADGDGYDVLEDGSYHLLGDAASAKGTHPQPYLTPTDEQSTPTPQASFQNWKFEPDATGELYEAISPQPMDTQSGSESRDKSLPGGGGASNALYDNIQLQANEQLYQEPPHGEAEVFTVLHRSIYRHIHRSDLELHQDLGGGNFGVVMKASWRLDGKDLPVAVKMLREGADNAQKVNLLKEAIIMGQFYHKNVVTMFGVVDDSQPYMLVLELMSTALRPYLFGLKDRTSKSVLRTLHRFCVDIAAGMAYLASREFVHRDLAARNVLLDGNQTCKIADFGLSRNLDGGDYYIAQTMGPIPVKWTAPEALDFHRYSTKSDVWSFGIVLHEIFAFGKKPYFGITNEKVIVMVREGQRMEKAARCPDHLYALQERCWNADPHLRPQFSEILQTLTQLYGRLSPSSE